MTLTTLRHIARLLWVGIVAISILEIGLAPWLPWGLGHFVMLVVVVTTASVVEGAYRLQDARLATATDHAVKAKAERRMAEIAVAEFARAGGFDEGGSRH